jgi:2-hydroxy-3-keto-5-methylthiopentenyl-1-phosphate phosphatase
MRTSKTHLYLDFDGTISRVDVIDAVLEKFADPRWLDIEEQWVNGTIGSRECLEKQFACVRASHAELYDFVESLEIDAGLTSVVEVCHEQGIPVAIISDGFEEYIRRMLRPFAARSASLGDAKIFANSLIEFRTNEWRPVYPHFGQVCADGCATCKPEVMKRNNPTRSPTIFVGDGLSDRFAAKTADTVFAKSKLSEYCREMSIDYIPFRDLSEVSYILAQMFGTEEPGPVFQPMMCGEAA